MIATKVQVQSKVIIEDVELKSEPRIFFKQMVEASGLFPIEINVPDTIGSMWSGMSSMYQAASSYFNGGSESEGQQQQVSYDAVVSMDTPAKSKQRKKKVKKLQKKKDRRSEMNMLDIFNFLMF